MYLGDLNQKINLRLTDKEFDFLVMMASALDESVSACARRILDDYITTVTAVASKIENEDEGDDVHGYAKTDFHD